MFLVKLVFLKIFFRFSIQNIAHYYYYGQNNCNMYSIIEFHDGIFAIPSTWLSADKKSCKWPPYDDRKIIKAVSKREEPDDNWNVLNVIKIFGTACDYDNAIKKVSLAEQLSDISDTENAKKTRKVRAHRTLSSEDSDTENAIDIKKHRPVSNKNLDNEEHPPCKKSRQIGSTATKATTCNTYPEFPTVSNPKIISLLSSKENNDEAMLAKHNSDTIIERKETLVNVPFFNKKHSIDVDHSFLTSNEKLDYLIELQKLNIKKGNLILTKINDIQTYLNNLDTSEHTKKNKVDANDNSNEDGNITRVLPIEDTASMNSFEEKLKHKEFYEQVVAKLYNQGGKNIDVAINRMMNLIFSNTLACNYSYFGKQKKKPFRDLVICKCVLDAVSRHNFGYKEDYIIKKIGNWLANAPTRQAREKIKTEKSEKPKDIRTPQGIEVLTHSTDESS